MRSAVLEVRGIADLERRSQSARGHARSQRKQAVAHIHRADGACETIAWMSELAEFQPTAESRRRFEDQRPGSKVWDAPAKDPATRGASIDAVPNGGRVPIAGNVGSPKALALIPRIAGAVEGVKAVRGEAGIGKDWHWQRSKSWQL